MSVGEGFIARWMIIAFDGMEAFKWVGSGSESRILSGRGETLI